MNTQLSRSQKVKLLLIFDNLNSKNSTESEKSEDKINNIGSSTVENSQKRLRSNSNLAKTFSCNVEDMTKNQLDQIKEIVKGKIEKETTNVSRKNSEKQ